MYFELLLSNHHRYSDPELGRYTKPEPLGIAGGNNLYAYAENQPFKYVDPLGLAADYIWDVPVILYDVGYGIFTGDWTPLQIDLPLAAVPFVPAGAGAICKSVGKAKGKVVYIGKVDDLKNVPRNQTILDELPDLGSPRANWKQNSSVLRRKLREGYEIRDVAKHRGNHSPDPTPLRPDRVVGQSFLGAERLLLDSLGGNLK